jgi:hypothetical protein
MDDAVRMRSHVLFIGGRSGVGKSSAALALHDLLVAADVQHAVIEGDYLDLAHPAPHLTFPDAHLAEQNLAATWTNYRTLGYRRLVYTNTAAVLTVPALVAAMGDEPVVTTVLLRSSDTHARARLEARALGSVAQPLLDHSATTARRLDEAAPATVHRVDTDSVNPHQVAQQLLDLTGWVSQRADVR